MSARNEDQRRSTEISNAVVRVFREYLGRGPTKARTFISDDMITVVCRDTMTKAERRLHERGEIDTVRHIRRKYQDAMRGRSASRSSKSSLAARSSPSCPTTTWTPTSPSRRS